jgi:tetratricopeptide (TPR) repeat protein
MKLSTLLFAALLWPSLALADDAAEHITKATAYYNIQDWQHALDEYKQAYTLDPRPDTLWAIAQTQRLSGDCRGAIMTYKAYMRGASAAGANAAQEQINKCTTDLEAQQRAIDAALSKPTPEPKPLPPPQPQPTPTPVAAPTPPPPAPAPQKPRHWALDPLGDTLFVVGLGGLVTGGVYLTLGNLGMSSAADKPTSGEYLDATSTARTEQKIGAVATIGGAVFATLAIWRFSSVASSNHRAEKRQDGLSVVPQRGGAFATYVLSF